MAKIKVPRFVLEYHNYQKRYLEEKFPLMEWQLKQDTLDSMESAISLYSMGFITVHEAMRLLSLDSLDSLTPEQLGLC